jgi:hypothetical protein
MQLTGPSGVGKSALARHTMNYVEERSFLEGGCVFVDAIGVQDKNDFFKKVNDRIVNDSSGWLNQEQHRAELDLDSPCLSTKKPSAKSIEETKFFRLLSYLRAAGEDFFFFFDNVDSLTDLSFVAEVLEKCPAAKVIVTGRR